MWTVPEIVVTLFHRMNRYFGYNANNSHLKYISGPAWCLPHKLELMQNLNKMRQVTSLSWKFVYVWLHLNTSTQIWIYGAIKACLSGCSKGSIKIIKISRESLPATERLKSNQHFYHFPRKPLGLKDKYSNGFPIRRLLKQFSETSKCRLWPPSEYCSYFLLMLIINRSSFF